MSNKNLNDCLFSRLGLTRFCGENDIKKKYKFLAKQLHPDLQSEHDKKLFASSLFSKLVDAYEILIEPESRQKYFEFCEKFHNHKYDKETKIPNSIQTNHLGNTPNDLDLQKKITKIKIDVSLEDLYSGCIKQLSFKRNNHENTRVELKVYPHYTNGTQILVNAEKNRDLLVELCEKPHSRFVRQNNDLVYDATISFTEATSGNVCNISVVTLDLRVINVSLNNVNEFVKPGTLKMLNNEGMFRNHNQRGDLFIRCNILLPNPLNLQQKMLITRLLQQK
eukprot:TRINITY_DN5367_c0_g1_i1.p1 TRINITY_DN5367_c0_g1~~TRINITY_DN5367_c0_g1_i1.p1  ORF type:complete len:279 (+),score=56.24 TRINITY_DN5367_c0_g1_i1:79-915(+)